MQPFAIPFLRKIIANAGLELASKQRQSCSSQSPYETLKQRAAISNCLPLIVLEKAWLVHLTCFFAKSANQQLVIRNSLLLLLRLVPLKSGSCLKLTRSNLEQGFRSRTHFNQVIVRRMQVELRAKRFRSASTRPPIANVQIVIRGRGKKKKKRSTRFLCPRFLALRFP